MKLLVLGNSWDCWDLVWTRRADLEPPVQITIQISGEQARPLVNPGNIPGDFDLRLERVAFLEVRLDLLIQLLRTIIPQVDIREARCQPQEAS